uniref:ATP synthase F0 subunit 8 n=1 Tax=Neoverruca intermedia TaxID=2977349 RepID=UPI0021CC95FE|nr:ATP synthase F0 subunit 8 [Neoverruca intermedia]UWM12963.1 ATP synthase F0 subunit 8 [Neoverruca intermedia]
MPHMAPMMWALIMMMNFSLILILTSMIYFNIISMTPNLKISSKKISKIIWTW